MKKLGLALALVLVLLSTAAGSSPASTGCVGNFGGGCINLDNDGRGPLFVHSLQPGVTGQAGWKWGYWEVWLTRASNGIRVRYRHSQEGLWVNITGTKWGPRYIIDKTFADGDLFCGDFSGWGDPGCVKVHD
jgi:hypothetical protein